MLSNFISNVKLKHKAKAKVMAIVTLMVMTFVMVVLIVMAMVIPKVKLKLKVEVNFQIKVKEMSYLAPYKAHYQVLWHSTKPYPNPCFSTLFNSTIPLVRVRVIISIMVISMVTIMFMAMVTIMVLLSFMARANSTLTLVTLPQKAFGTQPNSILTQASQL